MIGKRVAQCAIAHVGWALFRFIACSSTDHSGRSVESTSSIAQWQHWTAALGQGCLFLYWCLFSYGCLYTGSPCTQVKWVLILYGCLLSRVYGMYSSLMFPSSLNAISGENTAVKWSTVSNALTLASSNNCTISWRLLSLAQSRAVSPYYTLGQRMVSHMNAL